MNNITNIGQYILSVQQSIAALTSKVLDLEKLLIKEIANGQDKSSFDTSSILSVVNDVKKQLSEVVKEHNNNFSEINMKFLDINNKYTNISNIIESRYVAQEHKNSELINQFYELSDKIAKKMDDIEKNLDSRIVKSVDAIFSNVPVPKVPETSSVVDDHLRDIFANVAPQPEASNVGANDIEIVPKKTPGRKKVTPKLA